MPDQLTLMGGCLCGAVRYEATGTPELSAICHCRMCQRASCAPFMALLFMPSDVVKVTKGEPCVYRSSPMSNRHFCRRCGSPLIFERHTRSLYSVYARTRKTEALNFSISAALSDSDFRVLA